MAELRKDPVNGRWVIILHKEDRKPADYITPKPAKKEGVCAFCYGNEQMTPPEISAQRDDGSTPNTPGWKTRVIANKFPALRIEGQLNRRADGLYDMMQGIGAHEVLIETPDHNRNLADLTEKEVERVMWDYRNRSVDLRGDRRFKFMLIFKNYGAIAGASLEHPHSQLIALPAVPIRITEELEGAQTYYEYKERCVFCDMIHQEEQTGNPRVVTENKNFIAFCPFASRFPFETWILPREHNGDFSRVRNDQVYDLACILKEVLFRFKQLLSDPAYNFMVHTAPVDVQERDDYHWHIELIPKLVYVAGFEWGSGLFINSMRPEDAAKYLKEVK